MTTTEPSQPNISLWLRKTGMLVAAPLLGAITLLLVLERTVSMQTSGGTRLATVAALAAAAFATLGWFTRADSSAILRRCLLAAIAVIPLAGYYTSLAQQGRSLPATLWVAMLLTSSAYLVGSVELARTIAPQVGADSGNARGAALVTVVLHVAAGLAAIAAAGAAERILANLLPAALIFDTVNLALIVTIWSGGLAALSAPQAAAAARSGD